MPESAPKNAPRLLIDMDIVSDVLQKKTLNYPISSELVSKVLTREVIGVLPGFAIANIYLSVKSTSDERQAQDIVDWFLVNFEVAQMDRDIYIDARSSTIEDFVAALSMLSAVRGNCQYIVTRNPEHYDNSPVKALSPEDLLYELSQEN